MKNLIERIEELLETARNYYRNYSDRDILSETRGQIEAYQDCLDVLTQYNLITAPKEIKLSEIVSKIQEQSNVEIYFNRERNAIGYGEYDEDWRQNTWQPFVIFRDTKIVRICMPMAEITKWLYTLWIANVEIVDDLECGE